MIADPCGEFLEFAHLVRQILLTPRYPNMTDPPKTRATLLFRLREVNDQQAWEEFVDAYGPRVYGWCRRFHLQESDAADVTQTVLTRLVTAMQSFHYDPDRGTFRGWLKTVTNNAVRDFLPTLSRPGKGSGDASVVFGLDALRDPRAIEDLSRSLEQEVEQELLREAAARVSLRVKPINWEAWRLSFEEGHSVADVAAELNIRVTDVYVARSRVTGLLKREVERLNRNPAELT